MRLLGEKKERVEKREGVKSQEEAILCT